MFDALPTPRPADPGKSEPGLAAATDPGTTRAGRTPLDRYTSADSLFLSPAGRLLGQGVALELNAGPRPADRNTAARALADGARALLEQAARTPALGGRSVLMGAVPFDIREPARLVVPQRVWHEPASSEPVRGPGRAQAARRNGDGIDGPTEGAPRQEPLPEVFEQSVRRALQLSESGELDKVVLSRTLAVQLRRRPDLPALLSRLADRNTRGYTYAVPLVQGGVFVGATPELLVRRIGNRVVVNPLAGSAARSADPARDRTIAQTLMASDKDRREHAVVIDEVARALRPLCRTLDVPPAPEVVATDALWHLSTTLVGELADARTTSLDLALALHPTPAVCGYPTARAHEAIGELEPFARGYFAGFVGWCNVQGDGEWAVALRCAEIHDTAVRLYAGAGVVPGSVPASETAETATKFRTMLSALGLGSSVD